MEYRFRIANLILVVMGAFAMGSGFEQIVDLNWKNNFPMLFLIGFFSMMIPILKSKVRILEKRNRKREK